MGHNFSTMMRQYPQLSVLVRLCQKVEACKTTIVRGPIIMFFSLQLGTREDMGHQHCL